MKGSTIGFYFKLPKSDANRVRADLAGLAKDLGYTATAGPTAGQGNPSELLVVIAAGEVALVLLPEEHRAACAAWLHQQAQTLQANAADFAALGLAEDLTVIARSLQKKGLP